MQKKRISPCEQTHKAICNNGDHLTSMTPGTSNDFELFNLQIVWREEVSYPSD